MRIRGLRDKGQGSRQSLFSHDWGSTPLGDPETWPHDLTAAVRLCENATTATVIFWGREFRLIFNDAFSRGPAFRRPAALGAPASEVFKDIWFSLGRQLETVFETGIGYTAPEQILIAASKETEQETYWSYSLIPVADDSGRVMGIFAPGFSTIRNVYADRRLNFQVELSDQLRRMATPGDVTHAANRLLGENLGVSRVGFAQVVASAAVFLDEDWTRGPGETSFLGRQVPIGSIGEKAAELLLDGDPVVISNLESESYQNEVPGIVSCLGLTSGALILQPVVADGKLKAILMVHANEPRIWTRSEAAMVHDTAERAWTTIQNAMAEQSLRESEEHHRYTVELNPLVSWTAYPDGRMDRVSKRWEEWTGSNGAGVSWIDAILPEDKEKAVIEWRRAVESRRSYDIECRIGHRDGTYRWVRSRAFPRFDDQGNLLLWYGTIEDIHDMKQVMDRQNLLLGELSHRIKNTLSTVQGIAFLTFRGNLSLQEARLRFDERLIALSRASDTLTEQHWEGAWLEKLVHDTLCHLPLDRFEIGGAPVRLSPRFTLLISLVLHELGTNATKYGSLSKPGGKVHLSWTTNGQQVEIEWKENGGPPVQTPSRKGFGSKLIETTLSADLGGSARIIYEEDGVRSKICIPVESE